MTGRYQIEGRRATEIAASIEDGIRDGRLTSGAQLPPVRALAGSLGVSPATVASAYRRLHARGLLVSSGRRGTRVKPPSDMTYPSLAPVPAGTRNLADGNPDAALLPPLAPAVARLEAKPHLYGGPANDARLVRLGRRQFEVDGVPGEFVTIVGGALDGIERVLQEQLRPGDRIAVEDPGFPGVLDLVRALGLTPHPVTVDDFGPVPGALRRALGGGASALILTPRAQNPTGAALDAARASELRAIIHRHPETLLIEDDHGGAVSGAPALTLAHSRLPRWAVVRSVSKSLGPDLRLAIMAGDASTITRVEGRRLLGAGWVSHIIQRIVIDLVADDEAGELLEVAAETYATRRRAFLDALARRGIPAHGRSGLNVWVPVPDEARIVQFLLQCGWAVRGGEPFRLSAPPAVRVTIAALAPDDAERLAVDLARSLAPDRRTRPA